MPAPALVLGALLASATAAVAQPIITTVLPAANSLAAARNSPVTVTFSQPLTAGSAAALRVYSAQRGGQRARGTTPAVVSGNALTFTPSAYPFMPGETVAATVTRGAASSGGNLARAKVVQFTTAVGGTGRGNFQPGTEVAVGPSSFQVVVGDVDGDGDLDLLTANSSSNTVSVRLNGGDATGSATGVFSGGRDMAVGIAPSSLVLADMDGDGDLDLATGHVVATVGVYRNDGTGNFVGTQVVAVPSSPAWVVAGDVDGDGDLDLLTANRLFSSVSVLLNNGTSAFTNTQNVLLNSGSGTAGLVLGDVDGDGDLDLLASNYLSNLLTVRLNGGNATGSNTGFFSAGSDIPVGVSPYGVTAGDIDNDGDLDALTVNTNDNTVSVCLNNGTGSFTILQTVAVGRMPNSVALGDADADGDLDLFTTNLSNGPSGASMVSLRLNDGTGIFGSGPDIAVGNSSYSVVLGDVDADGDLDVLTANHGASTVSVRLNAGTGPLATHPAIARSAIALFPNPASHAVTITGLTPGQLVQVLDALGRPVATATADASGQAGIDWTSRLREGVYLVRAGAQTRRLVVKW